MKTRIITCIIALCTICMVQAKGDKTVVHAYSPFSVPAIGPGGEAYPLHVHDDRVSSRFAVNISGTEVAAVRYDNTGFGNQGHNMDVARFASNTQTPRIVVRLLEGEAISSVTVHPVRYYPQSALTISEDRKTVSFTMVKELPYAIVAINGGDPQDACDANPQLTLINDPLEDADVHTSVEGRNVLNFKLFAEQYLKEHPITEEAGQMCRPGGSVTDHSLNDDRLFTWSYDAGHFVSYDSKGVTFPNKRARNRNDVSDALQAALAKIKNTPELNTLYIPAGVYLWSGLRIIGWNGDVKTGGKPLHVYTDENALMINRQKECREALEPAIYIVNSSFVSLSGRGIHDGQGCLTFATDRKDAKHTPHQGGAVIKQSQHITFSDTYLRDSQQWNWETHDVEEVSFSNIKGLSPYNHGWIDGLNMSSGKNITINKALTLGNDDTFASGHYNPSNEFPERAYRENKSINLDNTDANPADIRHVFAAAGIYNKDRLNWSTHDTENIRVNNTLGWTRTAQCIRVGINTNKVNRPTDVCGRELKGFVFNNFNSVVGRKAIGEVRFVEYKASKVWPTYRSMVIKNSSFWTSNPKWAVIQTEIDGKNMVKQFVMKNVHYVRQPAKLSAIVSGVDNLSLKNVSVGGNKVSAKDLLESCSKAEKKD